MDSFSDFSLQGDTGFADNPFAEIPFEEVPFEETAPVQPAAPKENVQTNNTAPSAPEERAITHPANETTVSSAPTSAESSKDAAEVNNAEIEEEARKKAEHEAAEAKRKAEYEARQAQKKKDYQLQLLKMENMSDDDVMIAAAQRAGQDTEKITRRNMKECVSEYIQTMCFSDPAFARLTMHPRKNMIHCFQYINRKALEYVQDEMKASGFQQGPGMQVYSADIPDGLCYQWAVDYFRDPTVKEDEEQEEKFMPKPYVSKTGKKTSPAKATEKKKPEKKPTAKKSTEPVKPSEEGQLTFGHMAMV